VISTSVDSKSKCRWKRNSKKQGNMTPSKFDESSITKSKPIEMVGMPKSSKAKF
jgi:hypothetical protein